MFAIIKSGGKQYRVAEGDVLQLELLKAEPGEKVDLPIMMLGGDNPQIGAPMLDQTVTAEVVSHGRGEKIYIRKFKAKANYRRTTGHRQGYTQVRITDIPGGGKAAAKSKAKPVEAAPEAPSEDAASEE